MLNDFLTAVKNKVGFKHMQAFDMTRESQYAWQAFDEISKMLKKEIEMPTPYNDMDKQKKWEAKEKAVKNIMKYLDFKLRHEYDQKVKVIVREIEMAQNY